MKTADVAVALLNGFGAEGADMNFQIDTDNERRKQKLAKKTIGSNRQNSVARQNRTDASNSPAQAQTRISAEIEEAQKAIAGRIAARNRQDSIGQNIQYNLQDIKDMVSASIKANMNERRRAKQLSLGGGEAARILAEETRTDSGISEDKEEEDMPMIKPGEASLVASFSCLRPSIDGVDSMLRTAVACAASTLSIQQSITLDSLMASYNMATLYRRGFRYGEYMWLVELITDDLIDWKSYSASCTARPRLPQSRTLRPPTSMFHPSSIFPTLAQAVIHLTSMTVGVNYGSKLQSAFAEKKKGPIIRSFQTAQSGKLTKLANAFASQSKSKDQEEEKTGIFGRPPFRPNYETNILFTFSVLQATVSSLINHKGTPFYGSILESRPLCLSAGVTVLFAIACMTETFPFLNDFLELRRMPSRQSKLAILSIAFADVALCLLCRFISSRLLDSSEVQEALPHSDPDIAADVEEKLLGEESKQNRDLVLIILCFMVYMLAEVVFFG
jgi:hypothetical protein